MLGELFSAMGKVFLEKCIEEEKPEDENEKYTVDGERVYSTREGLLRLAEADLRRAESYADIKRVNGDEGEISSAEREVSEARSKLRYYQNLVERENE